MISALEFIIKWNEEMRQSANNEKENLKTCDSMVCAHGIHERTGTRLYRQAMLVGNLAIRFITFAMFIAVSKSWYLRLQRVSITCVISWVIYFVVYENSARLYNGFKSGNIRVQEIITAQVLSLLWGCSAGWIICCTSRHRIVGLQSFMLLLAADLAVATLWAYIMDRIYLKFHKPRRVLLVCPVQDRGRLVRKLSEKRNKFRVTEIETADTVMEKLTERKTSATALVLYGIEGERKAEIITWCVEHKLRIYVVPTIADIQLRSMRAVHLLDMPMVMYEEMELHRVELGLKRLCDILLSALALLLLSPLLILVSLAIHLEDGGPVFFRQERCTKDGRIFKIIKFRSMIIDADRFGTKPVTDGDARITKVGRWIRQYRIDELPQLVNIFRGDMSLVGPRPERYEFYKTYTEEVPEFRLRSRMRGGLTGYAQVYGKYNTTPRDKLALDLIYIENWSLMLDLKILFLTIQVCLKKESTEGFGEDRAKELTHNLFLDETMDAS